jgi:acylphosphatase
MSRQSGTAGPGALEARVRGRVQGVGFRYWTVNEAGRLRLSGWVRNEPDGSVTVRAEGDPAGLDRLVAVLKRGPAGARVDRVEVVRLPASGLYRGFTVDY